MRKMGNLYIILVGKFQGPIARWEDVFSWKSETDQWPVLLKEKEKENENEKEKEKEKEEKEKEKEKEEEEKEKEKKKKKKKKNV
jgi:hypothetical protein